MMGSTNPGPDPLTSLLGIVGDPEGTKKRIMQLQEATKANEDSLQKLSTRQAELDTRALELDQRAVESEKAEGAAADKHAALDAREKVIARKEQELAASISEFDSESKADHQDVLDHQATIEAMTKVQAGRQEELDKREADLTAKLEAIAADRAKLMEFEVQLHTRADDLDKRMDALKALVA